MEHSHSADADFNEKKLVQPAVLVAWCYEKVIN